MQRFHGYGRRVHVRDEVVDIWHTHRQSAADAAESFGVLMGTTSIDRREIWIESVTTPMAHDQRTRISFELRDPGHQRTVCGKFVCSRGGQYTLGLGTRTRNRHRHRRGSTGTTGLRACGRIRGARWPSCWWGRTRSACLCG